MQIIDISLSSQSVTPVFDAVQYDSARECGFFVEEEISSYDVVTAKFTIATGRVVPAICTVDDHLVTFILPLNLTRQAGLFNAVLEFYENSQGSAIHSFPFNIDVRENPSQDGDMYELAYEQMQTENARAETNNEQMEAYIDAYGTITPAQLTSLLSDLQNIWANFNGQDMTSLANAISAVDDKADQNALDIDALELTVSGHTTSIGTLNTDVGGLTTRMGTAESDIDTLEGLANDAVYHD